MNNLLNIKSNLPPSSSSEKHFDVLKYLNKKSPGSTTEADKTIKFWIGRSEDCQIIIADNKVSRKHCYIEKTPTDILKLVDNDSNNGTFVNNIKILEKILYEKDIIRISKYEIEVVVNTH